MQGTFHIQRKIVILKKSSVHAPLITVNMAMVRLPNACVLVTVVLSSFINTVCLIQIMKINFFHTCVPVSYTHLDVYKRQHVRLTF